MADITATDVKNLRERTGAGMMDCKKALDETNGDMEAAVDWLRAKGLAAAAKKSSRTAAEGLVGVAVVGHQGRCRRSQLRNRLRRQERPVPGFRPQDHRSGAGAVGDDVEALEGAAYPGGGTVERKADQQRRHHRREPAAAPHQDALPCRRASSCPTCTMPPRPTSARSACSSRWKAKPRADVLEAARQADRHAHRRGLPAWRLMPTDLDSRSARRANARSRRKRRPRAASLPNVQAKMVDGAVAKFAKENALLSQLFVMDNKTPIARSSSRPARTRAPRSC